jgi:YbgC/YbaW family acyl-CoA thioester hydrolase
MAYEYKHLRMVEFADTDMAGIVHFTRYFRYVEEAEHAFLRSLGLSVHSAQEGFSLGFPRISVRCEYLRPVRFEDELEIHIWVRRKGRRSLTYHFTISSGGESVARGEVVAICCRCFPDGTIETASLPEEYAARIEEAPYPPLDFRAMEF